jgi:hypothetical protein
MSAPVPTASQIADYYQRYFKNRGATKPCHDPAAENQCAVRLSCALEGSSSGFLAEFTQQNRIHTGRSTCSDLPPHVLGANELGQYLLLKCGIHYSKSARWSGPMSRKFLAGRPGIVWFEQCYQTKSGAWSDHIDFWTGWHYMNEHFSIGAGGNSGAKADLFDKSRGAVHFFQMTA